MQVRDGSLDNSRELLQGRGEGIGSAPKGKTRRQQQDRKWRHQKGAEDLVDLALNYEHLLLIVAFCGEFPPALIEFARYRQSYFELDGALRFRPVLRRVSLRERLRRGSSLRGRALDLTTDFLKGCLTIDPDARFTAAAALAHPWLVLP